MSLKCAVAVVVQLLPSTQTVDSLSKIKLKEYGTGQFALPWTYRSLSQCPDLIEPFPLETDETLDWEWSTNDLPKPKKKRATKSRTGIASHPLYPILFSDTDLARFREQLLGLVVTAQETKRFEAHRVVPRLTASILKEFDYLAEDSQMYPQLMLALACIQIECGYIEPKVADEAMGCMPTMERMYQLKLDGTQRQKANRELQKLCLEITAFQDLDH